MRNCWNVATLAAVAMAASPAMAQDDASQGAEEARLRAATVAEQARLAEERAQSARAEMEKQAQIVAEQAQVVAGQAQLSGMEAHEVELAMKAAEEQMAEAARRLADLSLQQLPEMSELRRYVSMAGRPVLGVTIGRDGPGGPVEGVEIIGVSPGGAAAEAGLRAGDVITSINGESLTSESSDQANTKLLDFMKGVEEGDVLDVDYLRNGNAATVAVSPRSMTGHAFAFGMPPDFDVEVTPGGPNVYKWAWRTAGSVWSGMELVTLSEQLGSYFGTDRGLLVVKAPDDQALKLQDGDVILQIGGREPTSVSHAMRILGSYESGEELEFEIMREKRKQTLSVTLPDDRRSGLIGLPGQRMKSRVVIAPRPVPAPPGPAAERI